MRARPPVRRLIVGIDIARYGRRDNVLQVRAHEALHEIMTAAADELGLDRSAWTIQRTGDGELAVLPADTDEVLVVSRLTSTLDRLLRAHNRGLTEEARVRLRVAMHEGIVHLDGAMGFPGDAPVTVCRLLDAEPTRAALHRFPHADVALIISDRLFQDIVGHYRHVRPDRCARVVVDLPDKAFRETAWLHVPDEDATSPGADPPADGG